MKRWLVLMTVTAAWIALTVNLHAQSGPGSNPRTRPASDTPTKKTDPDAAKKEIFAVWCAVARTTQDDARKLPAKKRRAWFDRTFKAREAKFRAAHRLAPDTLQAIGYRGMMIGWPVPTGDADAARPIVAGRQRMIDDAIFASEKSAYLKATKPPARRVAVEDFGRSIQASINRAANVPTVVCGANGLDSKPCLRKVVANIDGSPRRCYEHRGP